MQRKNGEIDRRTRLPRQRGQRRINRPAGTDTITAGRAFDEHRQDKQQNCRRQQPEGNIIHARKRHIRRTDHQRHEPVAETADHRRHDHEEDHDQRMSRDNDVEQLRIITLLGITGQPLNARILQFHTHVNGHGPANDPRNNREDQIHGTDILVIGRIDPALPSGGMIAVIAVCRGVPFSHGSNPLYSRFCLLSFAATWMAAGFVREANSSLAFFSQALNSSLETTLTMIGMKP